MRGADLGVWRCCRPDRAVRPLVHMHRPDGASCRRRGAAHVPAPWVSAARAQTGSVAVERQRRRRHRRRRQHLHRRLGPSRSPSPTAPHDMTSARPGSRPRVGESSAEKNPQQGGFHHPQLAPRGRGLDPVIV